MFKCTYPLSILFAILLSLITSPAYTCEKAQDENKQIDDLFKLSLQELLNIKVTGAAVRDIGLSMVALTHNPFKLTNCNTSASVEIIDEHTMQARGLNNVVEVVESMVGVLSGESPSEPYSFSMRGFSRDSVKILVNGISMGRPIFNMRPLSTSNLQRVEVIKGPSTIQYGQGAAGGTINMISKQASLTSDHSRALQFSQGDRETAHTAEFRGPINANTAYHLNTSYRASKGWVDDSDAQYFNADASFFWEVNPKISLIFSIDTQQDELPAYWGSPMVPKAVAIDPITDVIKTEDGLVIDGATLDNNYNVADHVIDSKSHWQRIHLNWMPNDALVNKTTLYQFSADRNWQNAESYIYNSATGNLDRDRLYVKHDRKLWGLQSGFTFTTELASRASLFSIDVEYSENDIDHFVGFEPVDFFVDDIDIQSPDQGTFNTFDVAGTVDIRKDTLLLKTSAITLSNKTELSQSLGINLAVKLENLDADKRYLNFDGSTRDNKTINTKFEQNSYSLGLVYALTRSISSYAQYSQQHDDITGDFVSVSVASNFEPSDISQAEIGLKAVLDEQQSEMTLALYNIEKEIRSEQSGQAFTTNEQTSKGIEFAIRTIISDQFRLGGNLAYTDAQYGDYYDAEGNLGAGTDATDNTPVNVPEKMASIWGSMNNIANLPLEAGMGINYVSSRFANTSNTVTLQDYTLVNVFSSYSHKDFRVALHIRNLTDEVYAPWSDIFYPEQVIIAPPRTIELSFQSKF